MLALMTADGLWSSRGKTSASKGEMSAEEILSGLARLKNVQKINERIIRLLKVKDKNMFSFTYFDEKPPKIASSFKDKRAEEVIGYLFKFFEINLDQARVTETNSENYKHLAYIGYLLFTDQIKIIGSKKEFDEVFKAKMESIKPKLEETLKSFGSDAFYEALGDILSKETAEKYRNHTPIESIAGTSYADDSVPGKLLSLTSKWPPAPQVAQKMTPEVVAKSTAPELPTFGRPGDTTASMNPESTPEPVAESLGGDARKGNPQRAPTFSFGGG